jgi:hypothetical protein
VDVVEVVAEDSAVTAEVVVTTRMPRIAKQDCARISVPMCLTIVQREPQIK